MGRCCTYITYTYKFLWDVIFADDRILELHTHCDCFKNFEDLIFMDDKLLAKTAKVMSHENLYVCGSCIHKRLISKKIFYMCGNSLANLEKGLLL